MVQNLFETDGGISFGYAVEKPFGPVPANIAEHPLRYTGDRHILTYAPTGAGKSRRMLLNNLLLLPNWSILAFDVKGELAQQTRAYREGAGNKVVLLNPFRVLGLPSNSFNPVAMLDPKDPDFVDDAMALAEALIRVSGQDSHWGESAQDLICSLVMYSRLSNKNGGSLVHVREMVGLSALDFAELVNEIVELGIKRNVEEMGLKAARYRDINPEARELLSIMSTAATQSRWLDSRAIKKSMSADKTDFRFAEMRERPMTVYVQLPASRLRSHSSYLRIAISAFMQSVLKESGTSKVPILLLLDEASLIGDLPLLHESIAILRSFGVKVWSLYQDLPQHKNIFHDRYESMVANSSVLAFAAQDMTTARMLSERSGQTTLRVPSLTVPSGAVRGEAAGPSVGIGLSAAPSLRPDEFLHFDDGYGIVYSHLLKGAGSYSYFPDPSEIPSFDRILSQSK